MSGTTATPTRASAPRRATPQVTGPLRRVRHEVRDGIAVMAFSAVVSSALAALLTVLARLGN